MTTTLTPNATALEDIKAAILHALPASDLMPVPKLRKLIPGTWWQQTHALGELEQHGHVYVLKVRGTPLVTRPLFPPSPDVCTRPTMVLP
ncbi:hypothetical protein ACNUDN_11805 [Mycobacterium sp. smrl_JER01]|uniref:hypothetical protein n=1 Tax=Mycobacterium sp. smrl_JER01 TaxID=3402633 RepID=UPI003ACF1D3F